MALLILEVAPEHGDAAVNKFGDTALMSACRGGMERVALRILEVSRRHAVPGVRPAGALQSAAAGDRGLEDPTEQDEALLLLRAHQADQGLRRGAVLQHVRQHHQQPPRPVVPPVLAAAAQRAPARRHEQRRARLTSSELGVV